MNNNSDETVFSIVDDTTLPRPAKIAMKIVIGGLFATGVAIGMTQNAAHSLKNKMTRTKN